MSRGALPDAYICPITSEIMSDPVSTSDGFTYEREAIMEWLRSGNTTSPLTGAALARDDLIPNHALRAAIQQFVEANPLLRSELYQSQATQAPQPEKQTTQAREPEKVQNQSTSGEWAEPVQAATPVVTVVTGMPMDTPAATVTAEPITGGGASASAGPVVVLTEEEVAAAAAFAVADWSQLKHLPKAVAKRSCFGGSGGSKPVPGDGLDPADLVVRASVSGYGGAALVVELGSERGLSHLARMLAARSTAPISLLELTTKADMPGTDQLWCTEGFALLTRALAAAPCLRELRELSISRISLPQPAATALGLALSGHRAVQSLELWNVELDDDGGLAVVRAVHSSCLQLRKLNLGRHLIGPQTAKAIEDMLDGSSIHLSLF